jgi:DNA invertase Pin-like site-specific DNA recombinase
MAKVNSTIGTGIAAAAYIRMSGRTQDKSPAEQRAEITKLATREGFSVVEWFTDEAITGDSSTADRAGLAALLTAAKAGKFKVVLAWHTNRVSREDPMDALTFYNVLRRAGVGLHTCCEGAIDLADFTKQLLLFVNQKASNDFLVELSSKVLRGMISNAKAGGRNGGTAVFGLDRGLFDEHGNLVRRLSSGECVRVVGHRVQLLPCTDPAKVEAVRFAFRRFDAADIGFRELAREMEAKSYPSPTGKGWTHRNVARLLRTSAYVGTCRWGKNRAGKYHVSQGEDIIAVDKGAVRRGCKPDEDLIVREKVSEGIIPAALFKRVQHKLRIQEQKPSRRTRRVEYPLAGLIYCEHCGQPMHGTSAAAKDRRGERTYHYRQYACSTYGRYGIGSPRNTTCGRHAIDAGRVLGWLIQALQQTFLGPGRDSLVKEIKAQLSKQAKASGVDVARLEKRAAELDREVGRLVKAIRTIDAAELVEELAIVRAQRDKARAELAQVGKFSDPLDLDAEAERIADTMLDLGNRLTDAEPATLREVLRQFVSRITCRWERHQSKQTGTQRARYRLVEGKVELRPQTLESVYGVVGHSSHRLAAKTCWAEGSGLPHASRHDRQRAGVD